MSQIYDVLIVGGGPAGLAAASGLVRQAYSILVLDSEVYRNGVTNHMHNVAGWDHGDPAEFRAKSRADLLARYDKIEFKKSSVVKAGKGEDELFELTDDQGGVYRGRKVILANGVRDRVEDMPDGFGDCYGRGIFHCLFCHGFEERGAASTGALFGGMIASKEVLLHIALLAKRLSKSTVIYTNGDEAVAAETQALIPAKSADKITVDSRVISRFELVDSGPAVKITFKDGTTRTEGFITAHPLVEQHKPCLASQLGLEVGAAGDIKVNPPLHATDLPGVFAVGDAATPIRSVAQALQMGSFAAVACADMLQSEFAAAGTL